MGLFAARQEDPFQWAGLPSEPDTHRTDAELLVDPPTDPFAISVGTGGSSISISLTPASPEQSAGDAEGHPAPSDDAD